MHCLPQRHQCQHRHRVPAADRDFIDIAARQNNRRERHQAECARRSHDHSQPNFPEVMAPHRPQQTHCGHQTDRIKNHYSILVEQVLARQCCIRPKEHQGWRYPKIKVQLSFVITQIMQRITVYVPVIAIRNRIVGVGQLRQAGRSFPVHVEMPAPKSTH